MPHLRPILVKIERNKYVHGWCPHIIAEINHIHIRRRRLEDTCAVLVCYAEIMLLLIDDRLNGLAYCEAIAHELWHFFVHEKCSKGQYELFSPPEVYARLFGLIFVRKHIRMGRKHCFCDSTADFKNVA